MEGHVLEWLNLIVRWAHVIAAIMWIGDSFLFMWMDSSLTAPSRPRPGSVAGELWMVHSGGFYEIVKRKYLAPDDIPAKLHWFKWEAYTTFITGFFLFGVLYFAGGEMYLLDRGVSNIGLGPAIALSLAVMVGGWFLYDALWRSPIGRHPSLATSIGFAAIVATAWGLTQALSGRAAFVLIGATLGTLMAANVWRVIIPAQNQMLAAARAGQEVDVTPGLKAKQRSTHNHYLTLPVLFLMLSHHFPNTYGHPLSWLVLGLMVIVGAAIKAVMNFRTRTNRWVLFAGSAALGAVIVLTAPISQSADSAMLAPLRARPSVPFAEARAIVERRCVNCHAARPSNPSFPEAPNGVRLDAPQGMHTWSDRILVRAVLTRTMPLGNLTGMTDEERVTLGAWIVQGADTSANE